VSRSQSEICMALRMCTRRSIDTACLKAMTLGKRMFMVWLRDRKWLYILRCSLSWDLRDTQSSNTFSIDISQEISTTFQSTLLVLTERSHIYFTVSHHHYFTHPTPLIKPKHILQNELHHPTSNRASAWYSSPTQAKKDIRAIGCQHIIFRFYHHSP
jgi:hypothetical protein